MFSHYWQILPLLLERLDWKEPMKIMWWASSMGTCPETDTSINNRKSRTSRVESFLGFSESSSDQFSVEASGQVLLWRDEAGPRQQCLSQVPQGILMQLLHTTELSQARTSQSRMSQNDTRAIIIRSLALYSTYSLKPSQVSWDNTVSLERSKCHHP